MNIFSPLEIHGPSSPNEALRLGLSCGLDQRGRHEQVEFGADLAQLSEKELALLRAIPADLDARDSGEGEAVIEAVHTELRQQPQLLATGRSSENLLRL